MSASDFILPPELSGQTLAAVLRHHLPGTSWSQVRRLISARRVRVNGAVCLDEARRLISGDRIDASEKAAAPAQAAARLVFVDDDLVIVEKAAGMQSVRRPEESNWPAERKRRQPVLEEHVADLLAAITKSNAGRHDKPIKRILHSVHRLDRDTSGLMLFARSNSARAALVRQFAAHEIDRSYLAVVHGIVTEPLRIESWLIRDRGDGLRGSSAAEPPPKHAKRAVTHIRPLRPIASHYTLIECRLETGRTHQIRIHLAERDHMLCGEKIYLTPTPGAAPLKDESGAPRQALHSTELEFVHPITKKQMQFQSPMPKDLARWIETLE